MAGLFAKSDPGVRATYDALLKASKKLGPVKVEEKKTCIHLVAGSAFAGIHPRKSGVLLSIRTARPMKKKRLRKCEKLSANRYHWEMLVASPTDLDAELLAWLKEAYELGAH
jgi:hypothetical protein